MSVKTGAIVFWIAITAFFFMMNVVSDQPMNYLGIAGLSLGIGVILLLGYLIGQAFREDKNDPGDIER
jgi:hypothetical protein